MRTLLLTSSGTSSKQIVKEIKKILPKTSSQSKIAFITTTSKPNQNRSYIDRDIKVLQELGCQVVELDIEGKTEDELRMILSNVDAIFVEGGNTFYLLKQVKATGFDKVIKELINKGVIYIGSSAGSYIACPTIEMSTWKKPAKKRYGLTDLTALNLVPFLILAHYKPEYKPYIKEGIKKVKYPVKIITDEQAILVKDDRVELVGKGKEIKI